MNFTEEKNKFKLLRLLNLESLTTTKNEETAKKNALKQQARAQGLPAPTTADFPYIAWSDMLSIASELDPDFNWRPVPTPNGEIFQLVGGGKFGAIVQTEVTFFGKTMRMQAAVTDSTNETVLDHDYKIDRSYEWTDKMTGEKKQTEKIQEVKMMTANDISNSIMRCLVKNIAEFGLAIDLWKGVRSNNRAKKADIEKFIQLCEDAQDLNNIYLFNNKREFWNELKPLADEKYKNLTSITEKKEEKKNITDDVIF